MKNTTELSLYDESLVKKSEKGVVTDRAFNSLVNHPEWGVRIIGNFNYKVKWIHDVYADSLFKNHIRKLNQKLLKPWIRSDEFDLLKESFDQIQQDLPVVHFTDACFRQTTGLKKLSGREIERLVDEYSKLNVEGYIYFWSDGDHWETMKVSGGLCSVVTKTTGRFSHRGSNPEHEYCFYLNVAGFIFMQNVFYYKIAIFKREFYRLSPGAQEMYRHIAQSSSTEKSFNDMLIILNYKTPIWNVQLAKKKIIGYLTELKAKGFIKHFKVAGRGQETKFIIYRVFINNWKKSMRKQIEEAKKKLLDPTENIVTTPQS